MGVFLSPVGNGQVFLIPPTGVGPGLPAAGGFINTYLAGTATPVATFTTNIGNVANGQPIPLTPAGMAPFEIWLTGGQAYKFVITDSNLNPIGLTYDNIYGVGDPAFMGLASSEWIPQAVSNWSTPTFISATQFSVVGDFHLTFTVNRPVQIICTAGTILGYVSAVSVSMGVTTVTVTMNSGTSIVGITVVNVGLIQQELSVPSGSNLIGFLPPGANAVATTVGAKLGLYRAVQDFGAKGDGITDDTAAFQAAIVAGPTYVPGGKTYLLNSALSFTNQNIVLFGDGIGQSILNFANGSGITWSVLNTNQVRIENLSIWTGSVGVGTAITGTWTVGGGTINTIIMNELDIAGNGGSATNYWANCISLTEAWNGLAQSVFMRGKNGVVGSTTAGIILLGNSNDFHCIKCHAYWMGTAVQGGGVTQGVAVHNCVFVAVNAGVDATVTTGQPGRFITDTHIASFNSGVFVGSAAGGGRQQMVISGNLFYKRNDSTANWIGVNLDGNLTDDCRIENNEFIDNSSSGTFNGIVCQFGSHSIIGNRFSSNAGSSNGINLGNSTTNCLVMNNRKQGSMNHITDTSTNLNNYIRYNTPVDQVLVLTANSATPNLGPNDQTGIYQTNNSGATTITNFVGAQIPIGDTISVWANDANTTVQHNGTTITLQGGANFAMGNGAILNLRKTTSTLWREVSRRTA